ncbi:class I SAM-dependent DNA methyltransferase [Paenibacillus crassostreae]|uniref:Methyltransferase domain-containing protein n=1 Tax=Paenibacillus crassostreae TaxID=1763538 RepID=A0A167FCM8_9BACL|nr:class I SAM-dependent methyltransferase [Paenibacillus crassostreae]AOZ90821.1 hypothetical protein LPB68_00440 [Paenibacillus crassostreae]OAB76414.1 hypothetical protein PNBC_03095 [Paenibacillus crassostreae]
MFDNSAEIYDALYSFKNYKHEADTIRQYLNRLNPNVTSLLDVACGTGKHIEYLTDYFTIDGIDLNERFIQTAQKRNSSSNFWCVDMTSFQLNKKYDVVMCLFSSIAYVKTLIRVKESIDQFKRHLSDTGIIIIEPWYTPDTWEPGFVSVLNSETESHKISRMSHAARDGDISILNFEYLVGSIHGIEHKKERHELGLFKHEELIDVFEATGMKVEYDSEGISGRGLYILSFLKEEDNSV